MTKAQEKQLTTMLDRLSGGQISIEEAADQVRAMKLSPPPEPRSVQDRLTADQQDPEPPSPGSFFAVSAAFAAGKITKPQYAALADAAAEAIRGGNASGGS